MMLIKSLFLKERIRPELVCGYKWRFPDKLNIVIKPSEDGGYIGEIKELPGCITQGKNGQEIFEMINDAIQTYLEIPEGYKIYMPIFLPPEEVRKNLRIKLPDVPEELILAKV